MYWYHPSHNLFTHRCKSQTKRFKSCRQLAGQFRVFTDADCYLQCVGLVHNLMVTNLYLYLYLYLYVTLTRSLQIITQRQLSLLVASWRMREIWTIVVGGGGNWHPLFSAMPGFLACTGGDSPVQGSWTSRFKACSESPMRGCRDGIFY